MMVYYLADSWQKDFAKNLDKIIKEKGTNYQQLALYLNMERSTIRGYVTKNRIPSLFTALSIADALNVPIQELALAYEMKKYKNE